MKSIVINKINSSEIDSKTPTQLTLSINEERDKFSKLLEYMNQELNRLTNMIQRNIENTEPILDFLLLSNMSLQMFFKYPKYFVFNEEVTFRKQSSSVFEVNLRNEMKEFLIPRYGSLIVDLNKLQDIMDKEDSYLMSYLTSETSNLNVNNCKSLIHHLILKILNENVRTPSVFKWFSVSKKINHFYPFLMLIFLYNHFLFPV